MCHGSVIHTVIRPDFQRIYIKEAFSIQCDPGSHCIHQCTLNRLRIFFFSGNRKHSSTKKRKPDRRAALRVIGVIRQVVIRGKPFIRAGASDPAGQIHSLFYDVVIEFFAGMKQSLILIFIREIRHRAVKIHRAHRMAFCRILHTHRLMALGILREKRIDILKDIDPALLFALMDQIIRLRSAPVHKILCHLKVTPLSGHLIQPDQPDLHLLMARYCLLKGFLVKYLTDQIRHTLHDVQEFLFSGHLIIGNRRLHKMSCGIKLMSFSQIAEFLIRLFDDKVSIQISVRLLRLSDQIDHRVRAFFQLGIRFIGK